VASSDQITLTVSPNTPPVVTITAPPDGASVPANQVTLVGVATDAEDGDISASLMWTSSKDGFIGTGASVTPNDLSFGSHTIEASVTDRKGATSSDSVSIKVKNPKSR
jgi:chitinase